VESKENSHHCQPVSLRSSKTVCGIRDPGSPCPSSLLLDLITASPRPVQPWRSRLFNFTAIGSEAFASPPRRPRSRPRPLSPAETTLPPHALDNANEHVFPRRGLGSSASLICIDSGIPQNLFCRTERKQGQPHLFSSLPWPRYLWIPRYPFSTASIYDPKYFFSYTHLRFDPYGLGDSYHKPPTPFDRFPLSPEPPQASLLLLGRRRARGPGLTSWPSESQYVLQYEPRIPGEWLNDAARSLLPTVRGEQRTE